MKGQNRVRALCSLFIALTMLTVGFSNGALPARAQGSGDEDAIKDVVTSFNTASEQATDAQDPTLEQAYTTDAYYAQLAQELQDDWDQGVVATHLVRIEWGAISVNGDQATAETTETWAVALDNGSAGQFPPQRNVYTLVRENGTWKVQADDHPDTDSGPPMI